MASASFERVKKSYGKAATLHGISFEVRDGEFIVLVGPSGCGKSTLLRMVAGLEDITGGEIAIDGMPINEVHPKERDIAMVFQNYALYPHMTVRENMGFSLKLRNVSRPLVEARVGEAATMLDLDGLLDRYPRELSGGQRQRVAMGRAIVRKPRLFLFDEPLSNLDARLRVSMRTEIKALHQRLGVTTMYVTHDQTEAMTLADRIVVMNGGRVEQIGAPLELYDRPANRFVAEFIGSPSMNFLDGTVEVDAGQPWLRAQGGRWPMPDACHRHVGRRLSYGFRACDATLTGPGDGAPATVMVVEPTGAETEVALQVDGAVLKLVLQGRTFARAGQAVGLTVEPASIHLFDATTGVRVEATEPA